MKIRGESQNGYSTGDRALLIMFEGDFQNAGTGGLVLPNSPSLPVEVEDGGVGESGRITAVVEAALKLF